MAERRRNGEGSFRRTYKTVIASGGKKKKVSSGWALTIRRFVDGKKTSVTFRGKTKKECQEEKRRYEKEHPNGPDVRSSMSLPDVFDFWLSKLKKPELKSSTYRTYYYDFSSFVRYFQNIKTGDFTNERLLSYFDFELERGICRKTLRRRRTRLLPFFAWCREKHMLSDDFIYEEVKVPVNKGNEQNIIHGYTAEEMAAILDAARNYENKRIRYNPKTYYYFILIALLTGMRAGELLGLTIQDIDFKRDLIDVTCELGAVFDEETHKTHYEAVPVKTASSVRQIPMSSLCRQAILAQMALDADHDPESFLFQKDASGSPVVYRAMREHMKRLEKTLKKQGKDIDVRAHRFRHTFSVSWISGSGVSRSEEGQMPPEVPVLSRTLGHSSSLITNDVYLAVSEKGSPETMQTLRKVTGALPSFDVPLTPRT